MIENGRVSLRSMKTTLNLLLMQSNRDDESEQLIEFRMKIIKVPIKITETMMMA